MNQGWVKIHRKIKDWEWYDDAIVFRVFIHLVLSVNHVDKKWRGKLVKRGQLITSYQHLSDELSKNKKHKVGVQSIRTALNKLKSTGELTSESTNEYTIITVGNYNDYQTTNKRINKRLTNEQQTTNKRLTTTKELKNEKNEKKREGKSSTPAHAVLVQELISYWNETYSRKFRIPKDGGWIKNFRLWLKTYSVEEMKQAVDVATNKHHFYYDKLTPDMLFRKNTDRIGELLNYKPKEGVIGADEYI